jgi:subtilisin family serine protease
MRKRFALLVGVLGVALLALPAAGALSADSTQTYIVQMLAKPVVAYDGGVSGLAATKPAQGKKIDPAGATVTKYAVYLKGQHDAALSKVGGGQKLYDYVYSYDGFAAKLTDAQAAMLQGRKDVVAVTRDELQTVQTSSTPHFLGLDDRGGLWDQLGGPVGGKNGPGAGEGMIIGVVDSGIWPEAKSFSDRDASGKLVYQQVPGWHGKCTPGEQFTASDCNQKLIGAQWFDAAWGGDGGMKAQRPWEFASARDYNSHGTHTSSTAGGNFGVQPTGDAAAVSPISGMAPRARIAMYKALYSTKDASTASGFNSDLVEAIDQAVADGVDVINYSVGPSSPPPTFLGPEQVAFLFAADAGVFVSAAAGNAGPALGTMTNPGPWLTTAAAGTHNRNGVGSVTLGNGSTIQGASFATAVGPAPFVDAEFSAASGATTTAARLCFSKATNGGTPALDPAKVGGKIVLCDRGTNARIDKSLAVKEAGGIGMVLVNTSPNSLNADLHFVPTVHVADTNRAALKAYAATAGATATINQSQLVFNVPAPTIAVFSSRGPALAGGGDLLKPDVMAPGQDVIAAVSPVGDNGRNFDLLSGTSMATPHVAGVAALLMQLHPTWSPMAIKSSLMTSAYDVVGGAPGTDPAVIFGEGAGHIKPNSAADPGLVYDNGFNDWLAFLCGAEPGALSAATCNALHGAGYSLDPSDLNVASIAIGDLAGAQTVTRRVTNVGKTAATYNASVVGMAGVTVNVNPSSLTLNPGQTKSFAVSFTRSTATLGAYVGGRLIWSDGTHNVRIPMVVKPVALAAPREISGSPSGISYTVKTGYNGTLNFAARGLVPATTTAASVDQDPDQTFDPTSTVGTYKQDIVVPAGVKPFRVGIDESTVTPSGTDLDVYLYRGSTRVGQSSDGDSNEMVTLTDPAADTYTVYVHGFSTIAPSANFTLYNWQIGAADAGNMHVPAPATATIGGSVGVSLSFTGLAAGTWYLGQVIYNDGSSDLGSTIVNVK